MCLSTISMVIYNVYKWLKCFYIGMYEMILLNKGNVNNLRVPLMMINYKVKS